MLPSTIHSHEYISVTGNHPTNQYAPTKTKTTTLPLTTTIPSTPNTNQNLPPATQSATKKQCVAEVDLSHFPSVFVMDDRYITKALSDKLENGTPNDENRFPINESDSRAIVKSIRDQFINNYIPFLKTYQYWAVIEGLFVRYPVLKIYLRKCCRV